MKKATKAKAKNSKGKKAHGANGAESVGSDEMGCGCSRPKSTVRLASCIAIPKHRQHLRMMAESWEIMTDSISVTDPESGRLLYVNGAWRRLYGYPLKKIFGATVDALINPKSVSKRLRDEIRAKTYQGHWCGRLLNRDAKGREFPVDLSTGLVSTAEGELVGLLGVCTPLRGEAVTSEQIDRMVNQHQETMSEQLRQLLERDLFNGSALTGDGGQHGNGIREANGKPAGNGNGKGCVADMERLSQREQEVFGLIGRGMSTLQIARRLRVSQYTIQAHRNRIRDKLNIPDSATLTFRAYQCDHAALKNKAD